MSEKVTFQELIDSIAEETDSSREFIHDFLKDFVSIINAGLEKDGKVNIAGFGKFELRRMDEREGYNPQTDEKMTIPAHNKVVFKPYKDLRELVNVPYAHLKPEIIQEDASGETSETGKDEEKQSPPSETPDEDTTENIFDFSDLEKGEGEQRFTPGAPPPVIKSESNEEDTSEEEEPKGTEEPGGTTDDPFGLAKKDYSEKEDSSEEAQRDEDTGGKPERDVIEYHSGPGKRDDEEDQDEISSILNEYIRKAKGENEDDSDQPEASPDMENDEAEDQEPETEEPVQTDPEAGDDAEKPGSAFEEKTNFEDLQEDEHRVEAEEAKELHDEEEIVEEKVTPEREATVTEPIKEQSFDTGRSRSFATPSRTFSTSKKRTSSWMWGVAAVIILLLIVFGIWYFIEPLSSEQQVEPMTSAQKEQNEAVKQPQEPSSQDTDADPDAPAPADDQQQDASGQPPSQTNARGGQQRDVTEQTVNRGETLWSIADDSYKDPYLWPWIYDANKETIHNPNLIYAGQSLSIPMPDEPDYGLSSTDSLEVAIGYVETYLWHKEQNIDNAKYYLWAATKYDKNILDHIPESIDEQDLAFVNRVR